MATTQNDRLLHTTKYHPNTTDNSNIDEQDIWIAKIMEQMSCHHRKSHSAYIRAACSHPIAIFKKKENTTTGQGERRADLPLSQ